MKIQTIDGKGNGVMAVRVIIAVVCFAVLFLFSDFSAAQGAFYVEEIKEAGSSSARRPIAKSALLKYSIARSTPS